MKWFESEGAEKTSKLTLRNGTKETKFLEETRKEKHLLRTRKNYEFSDFGTKTSFCSDPTWTR